MAEARVLAHPVLLIAYSEIALKGRKRSFMERALRKSVQKKLLKWGVRRKVFVDQGRVVVWGDAPLEVRRVPGVHHVIRARALKKVPPKELAETISKMIEVEGTFAVRVRRADKRYPLKSPELAALIGSRIEGKVDLKNPQTTVFVEVRDLVYVYTNRDVYEGVGGLPYGTEGEVYVDFRDEEAGIVAAALLAKRGARVVLARPYRGAEALAEALPEPLIVSKFPFEPKASDWDDNALIKLDLSCLPPATLKRVELMLGKGDR